MNTTKMKPQEIALEKYIRRTAVLPVNKASVFPFCSAETQCHNVSLIKDNPWSANLIQTCMSHTQPDFVNDFVVCNVVRRSWLAVGNGSTSILRFSLQNLDMQLLQKLFSHHPIALAHDNNLLRHGMKKDKNGRPLGYCHFNWTGCRVVRKGELSEYKRNTNMIRWRIDFNGFFFSSSVCYFPQYMFSSFSEYFQPFPMEPEYCIHSFYHFRALFSIPKSKDTSRIWFQTILLENSSQRYQIKMKHCIQILIFANYAWVNPGFPLPIDSPLKCHSWDCMMASRGHTVSCLWQFKIRTYAIRYFLVLYWVLSIDHIWWTQCDLGKYFIFRWQCDAKCDCVATSTTCHSSI